MAAAQVVSEATALVRECLADGKLDAGEILRIGIFVAEKVNVVKGLTGPEKKEFVLEVLKKAVEAAVPAEQREQAGYTAAIQVLPTVLDIAVAAAHGKVALQRVRERVSVGCLVGCLSGLWGKRENPAAALAAAAAAVRDAVVEPVAVVPAPVPVVPDASQESVPAALEQKDTSPQTESPKEPSPQASAEAPPLESRPPEVPVIELPNTASEPVPDAPVSPAAPLPPVPEEPVASDSPAASE